MKKTNKGSDLLIPKEEWVDERLIQGNDYTVINSKVINQAFDRIMELHKPKHKVAFVSLCTSTRPYSKSRKWKKFKQLFENDADLIICSNGGIIPIGFENCYPFLTYDAHGQKQYDQIYIKYIYNKLMKFFSKFEYEKIVFDFRPNLRNRVAAKAFKENYKGKAKVVIVPTIDAYERARKTHFAPAGSRYPDLSQCVLEEITKEVKNK